MTELEPLVNEAVGERRVVVAFSGGLDSTVLLHAAVWALGAERVVAAHVNHHLRDQADEDANFCRDTAKRLGVAFFLTDVQPDKSNAQARARRMRYAALGRIADATGSEVILTAHHADDVVETFLERLARGAGLSAMVRPRPETEILGTPVARPLLSVRREQIASWADHRGLSHRHDASNDGLRYRRNAIRNVVVPELTREQGPAPLRRSISNLADEARLVEQAVEQLVMAATRPSPGLRTVRLDTRWLQTAEPALRRGALLHAAGSCAISLEHAHFDELERPRTEPVRIDLPNGHAEISSDFLTFYADPAVPPDSPKVAIDLGEHSTGALPWYDVVVIWGTDDDGEHLWLPDGALLELRGPRSGETLATESGHKAIRDLLRDAGVPAEDRWRWPCLAHEDEVLSVVGVRTATRRLGEQRLSVKIVRRARGTE